ENAKLRQDMEEYEIRFAKLEQNDKEKTNLIAKLDDDIKGIKQDQIVAISLEAESKHKLTNSCLISDSSDSSTESPITSSTEAHSDKETSIHCESNNSMTSITPITPKQIEFLHSKNDAPMSNIFNNSSNSDVQEVTASSNSDIYQDSVTPTSPIPVETISLEEKEENEFLNLQYKEQVSKEIMERIREKKLRDQELLSTPEDNTPNISYMSSDKISEQNTELIDSPDKPLTNLIVEQELQQQIAVTTGDNNSAMLDEDSMQNIDISINDLSPVSVQTIVCIFRKAIRSGQDTILYWYHFAGKYDRRIDEISVSNKVGKKKATSLVYHEIKQFLPDITDVNLRHIILKARKIRTLFSAVGIEKIKQVSYSANAISNLSYTQIQNIVNYVNEQTSNSNIPLTKKTLEETEVNEVNISIKSQSLVLSSNKPSPENDQDLEFSGTKIQ
ncbi:3670_t:CDS:2, partial [Diversispora eburnea]